jgi:hypothetical protein
MPLKHEARLATRYLSFDRLSASGKAHELLGSKAFALALRQAQRER